MNASILFASSFVVCIASENAGSSNSMLGGNFFPLVVMVGIVACCLVLGVLIRSRACLSCSGKNVEDSAVEDEFDSVHNAAVTIDISSSGEYYPNQKPAFEAIDEQGFSDALSECSISFRSRDASSIHTPRMSQAKRQLMQGSSQAILEEIALGNMDVLSDGDEMIEWDEYGNAHKRTHTVTFLSNYSDSEDQLELHVVPEESDGADEDSCESPPVPVCTKTDINLNVLEFRDAH